MKLETPFQGALAVLGVRGRSGHLLALGGAWALNPGAPVKHATKVGEVELYATIIGEITRIAVMPQTYGMVLMAYGHGTTWLADLLDEGSHALSTDMANMTFDHVPAGLDVIAGQVRGALLVRADAFAWAGVRA